MPKIFPRSANRRFRLRIENQIASQYTISRNFLTLVRILISLKR